MKLPYFYFCSFEVYSKGGSLKQKCFITVSRGRKICDPADFEDFVTFIRADLKIPAQDIIHFVSIQRLNA